MIRLIHGDALTYIRDCGEYDCILIDNIELIPKSMAKAPIVWISCKKDTFLETGDWHIRTFNWRYLISPHRMIMRISKYRVEKAERGPSPLLPLEGWHPESLMERIFLLSGRKPRILDLFTKSTGAQVAKRMGIDYTGIQELGIQELGL